MGKVSVVGFKPIKGWVHVHREPPQIKDDGIFIPEIAQFAGFIAEVLGKGGEVDDDRYDYGDKIVVRPNETFLPFHDSLMAVTRARTIMAKLAGIAGMEEIHPLNGYVLVSPDAKIESIGDVNLPDKAQKMRFTGVVTRISTELIEHDENKIEVGSRLVYNPFKAFPCIEAGHEMHLINDAMAVEEGENVRPIGQIILVEVDKPEQKLIVLPGQKGLALPSAPNVVLPEQSVRPQPTGIVRGIGNEVKTTELAVGDTVLLRQTSTGSANPGTQYDPDNEYLRLVHENDVIGKF